MVGTGVVELAPKKGSFSPALTNVPMSLFEGEICQWNLEYCWSRTLMNSPGSASGQVQHPWALGSFTNAIWYCEIFCELAPP